MCSNCQNLPDRPQIDVEGRLAELAIENLRLQRLVAELLLKNQQLRDGAAVE
jgi:hypothetical protein